MALLETSNLTIKFGGLTAVENFNLSHEAGEIVGLIGPNGAGKTTVFNLLTGIYRPTQGKVIFLGEDIALFRPYRRAAMGLARTFQNIRLFGNLTVLQNVMIACHPYGRYGLLDSILRTPSYLQGQRAMLERALGLLEIFGLKDRKDELARNLPYGHQRRLEIARALATSPKMLLLDEPAAGMNPQESEELLEFIRLIHRDFKLTILLIEHHMDVVMGVCDRIVVLNFGRTIATGGPADIQSNKEVIEAYLGEDETA